MGNEDFSKFIDDQKTLNKLIDQNTVSMGSFVSAQANSIKLSKQLKYSEEQLKKQVDDLTKAEKKLGQIKIDLANESLNLSADEIENLKIIQANLITETKLTKKQIAYHEAELHSYREKLKLIKLSLSSWESIGRVLKNSVGDALKSGWNTMLDQDKAVRKTQLSMGILTNQSQAFAMNIYKTSAKTQMLGANAKDLAGYQKDYSEQIGRTVILSEDGLQAMTEIAKGTILGSEGATKLTAEMDNFGISVLSSRDIVEDMVNSAHKMGVNSASVTKTMLNSLRLAQKYHFKDGVKNITEMSIRAEKFKMTMEGIAGFADKLFTPEGAIDAAAQLQVLGGEWSKIADPFKLMYQARNDMSGLQKSMIEATAGVAQFNKATGEFEISGMELHRLREIAKVTGQDVGELAQSAKEFAKAGMIKSKISASIDPELTDFLTSTAQFKDGNYFIEIGSKTKNIQDLTALNNGELRNLILQKENLKKRALESNSFDDTWSNLVDSFKATLLPFMKGIELGLRRPLNSFIEWLDRKDIVGGLSRFSETMGKLVVGMGEFIVDNPIMSALTLIGGMALFETGKWVANGAALRLGFEGAGGLMGSASGGLSSGLGGLMGKNVLGGKLAGGTGGAMLAGAGLGIAGLGLSAGRNLRDDPNDSIGKGMGIGGSALTGAGIGMMLGPWGAAVGALLGGAYGAYNEFGNPDELAGQESRKVNDFVMRPGSKAQPFSENDTLIGFKPGGPIDKNNSKESKSNNSPKTIKIEFSPIKIEFGKLTLVGSDGNESNINFMDNPLFQREIASMVQEQLRKAIGGGILNPNPIGV